ncbi:MAG TPA: hypothetical protein VH369_04345 [Bryobacteraceae bacterium]
MPGIIPLPGAIGDCVIRDVEMARKLDLDACRPESVTMVEKAAILQSLPIDGAVTQFGSGERYKLRAIDAILCAHRRMGVYEIRVIAVPQAWVGLHNRVVLLISLPALNVLNSEELQALVAHEIGHEYVWEQYAAARTSHEAKRLRELELICDAIAIATLTSLNIGPERLLSATEKVFWYNREHLGVPLDRGNYPSLHERRQLILKMTRNP